jgi:UDP-glucose 4-epimerase
MQIFGTDYPTNDGTCVRDYIHVKDLTKAHMAALVHLRRGGASDIFNCGYSRGFSVREVIAAVKAVSGVDFNVELAPPRAGDPAAIVARSDKIRQALGWQPAHDDLEGIVRNALDWERRLAELKKEA